MTEIQSPKATAPWQIRLAIWAAFLIAAGSASLLYYRYLYTPQPNCILVIFGNRTMDQNVVTVEGAILPEPIKVILCPGNSYSARVFLDSAAYHVKVFNPDKPDKPLLDDHTFIAPGFRQEYNLNRLYPDTQPTRP